MKLVPEKIEPELISKLGILIPLNYPVILSLNWRRVWCRGLISDVLEWIFAINLEIRICLVLDSDSDCFTGSRCAEHSGLGNFVAFGSIDSQVLEGLQICWSGLVLPSCFLPVFSLHRRSCWMGYWAQTRQWFPWSHLWHAQKYWDYFIHPRNSAGTLKPWFQLCT